MASLPSRRLAVARGTARNASCRRHWADGLFTEKHDSGFGGSGRNRTGVDGFAGRCMTTLPPSPEVANKEPRPDRGFEVLAQKRSYPQKVSRSLSGAQG
jgi:hypothetical protein